MHIRAGIIYNIAYDKLSKQHISEIFYWSNNCDYIMYIKIISEILSIKDVNYYAPIDFDCESYFSGYEHLVDKYLLDVNNNILAYYFLEYYKFESPINPISKWNKNTKGLNEEKSALFRFNNVYGYNIQKVDRGEYNIPGTTIVINGKPDGIIKSSPGGIFNDYIVEIKYQSYITDETKLRNKYQVCTYCKIFNKPVLLIIYNNGKYLIYRYTKESLNYFWNKEIMPRIYNKLLELKNNVIINEPNDIIKYEDYIKNLIY